MAIVVSLSDNNLKQLCENDTKKSCFLMVAETGFVQEPHPGFDPGLLL